MSTGWPQALVAKEVRALGPVWLAAMTVTAAAWLPGVGPLHGLGAFAFVAGSAAVGALPFGHEYAARTLTTLLAQPVRRSSVLALKLGVVVVMLAPLAAIGGTLFRERVANDDLRLFVTLSPICALCVAPLLTMLCRSTLAGIVFTAGVPGSAFATVNVAYYLIHRTEAPSELVMSFVWWGTLSLCGAGIILGWHKFIRLEALDGPGAELMSPTWMPGEAGVAKPRHPLRALVEKEIGLQGLPLILTGIYVAGWLATFVLRRWFEHAEEVFGVLSVLQGLALPVLMGVLASAEERHLGTLEWQTTLPVASSRQWAVKLASVVGLTWLLATVVPWLMLTALHPSLAFPRRPEIPMLQAAAAVTGLYISSLSSSGVLALAQAAVMSVVASIPLSTVLGWWLRERFESGWTFGNMAAVRSLEFVLLLVVLAPLVKVGLDNHRSAEPAGGRPLVQLAFATAWLTAGAMLLLALSTYV